MVFRAVVNEALLSALEVRVLTRSDLDRLEAARGLLLRRIFGRRGYGKVTAEQAAVSVPVKLLLRVCGLTDVAVELRVRRLLWLCSSLLAEQSGEVRLELASLFGTFSWQAAAPVDEFGQLTSSAPSFLALLNDDMQSFLPDWTGFAPGWKETFLSVAVAHIRALRGTFDEAILPPVGPLAAPHVGPRSREPRARQDAVPAPLGVVDSPAEVVRSLMVFG